MPTLFLDFGSVWVSLVFLYAFLDDITFHVCISVVIN